MAMSDRTLTYFIRNQKYYVIKLGLRNRNITRILLIYKAPNF